MQVLQVQDLGDLTPSWDRIAGDQPLASPFLRSWWLRHAAAGTPAIVCCVDRGELLGGAAFELDRVGAGLAGVHRVRCLGQGPLAPDHLDVIAVPGRRREVLETVARWLRSEPRVIDLDGLSPTCELPYLLDMPVVATTRAPYIDLGADDPLAHLPGRLRSTIKRTTRRLERLGFNTRRVDRSDAERALDTLQSLHDARWIEDSGLTGPAWERFAAAARAGMEADEVVLHELADPSGSVIASEVELVVAGRASFYQAGRLTDHEFRGSGSALKAAVIGWASQQGCTELDLLRGEEPYKAEWSTGTREVIRTRGGNGARARLAAQAGNRLLHSSPQWRESAGRLLGQRRAEALSETVATLAGRRR